MKWTGPAQWTKREARAGDRLPFDRHIDDATIRLRDGAVMRTLHIGGMEFETQDADQLDHAPRRARSASAQRARRPLRALPPCRSSPRDRRFRRRVRIPFCAAIGKQWDARLAGRRLFVSEQFLTIVRRPARGKTGYGASPAPVRPGREDDPATIRDLEAATASLLAGLEAVRRAAAVVLPHRNGRTLGASRVPFQHLQWRDAAGRPSFGRHRPRPPHSVQAHQLRSRRDRDSGRRRPQFLRHALDQGIPGGNASRPDRQHPSFAVRIGADRDVCACRPSDRARADGSRFAARRRAKRIAGPSGARCCPHATRLARGRPVSATITSASSSERAILLSSTPPWRTHPRRSRTLAQSRCART